MSHWEVTITFSTTVDAREPATAISLAAAKVAAQPRLADVHIIDAGAHAVAEEES